MKTRLTFIVHFSDASENALRSLPVGNLINDFPSLRRGEKARPSWLRGYIQLTINLMKEMPSCINVIAPALKGC